MALKRRCRSLSDQPFFGLIDERFYGVSDDYLEKVYKQLFYLQYFGKFDWSLMYNLPILLRDWYAKLLEEQKQYERDRQEEANSKAGKK